MKKITKKMLGVVMAMMLIVALIPMSSLAEEGVMQPEDYKVISDLSVSGFLMSKKISGTVNLTKIVSTSELKPIINEENTFSGVIVGTVESADLFEGAYKVYEKSIKGKGIGPLKWENIVMYSNGEKFPTAEYTITFPSNFKIDFENVSLIENTSTISSITKEYIKETNSVKFVFNLGNWNDYKGFFELVSGERGKSGHEINISIPYTVTGSDFILGEVTGSGACYLYKYGNHPIDEPIVNITSPTISIDIERP